jgi:WD40 repeat protein
MRHRYLDFPVNVGGGDALSTLNALRGAEGRADGLRDLVGAPQLWWRCCAEADGAWLQTSYDALTWAITRDSKLDEAPVDALLGHAGPGIAYAVDLLDEPTGSGPRKGARRQTLLSAARSIAGVALSMTSGAEGAVGQGELVSNAVTHWGNFHALPDVTATSSALPGLPATASPGLRNVAKVLDRTPTMGLATAMVGVQALLLSGVTPSRLHRQRIGILLDASEVGSPDHESVPTKKGRLGTLTVSGLPGGAPGLFPDPRSMGFFEADADFALALTRSWAYATRNGGARCLLWSLMADSQEPFLRINGPSLGAAFAIALSEAVSGSSLPRRLLSATSLKMMRTGCAVTGGVLGDGRLEKVDGIGAKVEALRGTREFLVIAPKGNEDDATISQRPASVQLEWVRNVGEARRLTRRVSRVRVAAAAVSACVLAAAVAVPVYLAQARQAGVKIREAVATQLVATASQLNASNPPLAMLLALQANAQDPSDRTRNGLLSQLAADGSLVRTLHGHAGKVVDAGISTIGGILFAITGGLDGNLRVWDLATGKCTDVVSPAEQGGITAIAVDPVLPNLVLVAGANVTNMWTLTPAGQLTNATLLAAPDGEVVSAAFSTDGVRLALGYEDGSLALVNPTNGSVTGTVKPWSATSQFQEPISAVTFGPDDNTIYAGDTNDSVGGNGVGNLYQVGPAASGRRSATLVRMDQHGSITSLSYAKRAIGPAVLFIGTNEGIQAWDPAAGQQLAAFPLAGISSPVTSIKSNAQITAVGTTSGVTIIQNNQFTTSGPPTPGVAGVGLDDSGTYLLTTAPGGDVYEWDLGAQPLITGSAPVDWATTVAFAPDGGLVSVDDAGELGRYPEVIPLGQRRWPASIVAAKTGKVRTLAIQRVGGQEVAALGDWSPDSSQVVLVNLRSGSVISAPRLDAFTRTQQCGGVRAVAFTPDGSRLLIACWFGGQLTAWDTSAWRETARASLANQDIQTLAIAGNGTTAVAGTSPDPVGSDGQPQALWFLSLPDLHVKAQPVAAHPGGVTAIVPGGQHLYSGGWDGTIRSWGLDGRPTGSVATVDGHVFALAYDQPSGLLVASTSEGLTLYDPINLEAISPAIRVGDPSMGPQFAVQLAVSPDGWYVAGALTTDKNLTGVVEWAVTKAGWIAQMCAKADGNLTPAQWVSYGSPSVSPVVVCPSARLPGLHPSSSGSAPSIADPSLTAATNAPIRPRVHGACADLATTAKTECGLFGTGYAWTISPVAKGALTVTIYATLGSTWKPILATPSRQAWGAKVVPVTTQRGEQGIAVWQIIAVDGSDEDLSIVQDGRITYDQAGLIVAAQPQAGGLRIWMGVYRNGDPMCCPSGYTSGLLIRRPNGQWATQHLQAVPANSIPKMTTA